MKSFTSPTYWNLYNNLPNEIQLNANKAFELFKLDPHHPSLKLKKIKNYYSARINIRYRVLGIEVEGGILWIWIGNHDEYERLIK